MYLKYTDISNFKSFSWSSNLEIPSKILGIKYKNNNLIKVYLIISLLQIITFALYVGFYTEKPNIDGFIDNNEKLFLFQDYKIEEIYYGLWIIDSSMTWYSILLATIYFICLIAGLVLFQVSEWKILLQVKNQLVILYKKNEIKKISNS